MKSNKSNHKIQMLKLNFEEEEKSHTQKRFGITKRAKKKKWNVENDIKLDSIWLAKMKFLMWRCQLSQLCRRNSGYFHRIKQIPTTPVHQLKTSF